MRNNITNCCANCFSHPWLKEYISGESQEKGLCPFCGSSTDELIDVAELSPLFANMLSIYHPVIVGETIDRYDNPLDVGDQLVPLVQEDWNVFDEGLIESGRAAELLEEIANSTWDDDSGEPPIDANDLWVRRISIWHSSMAEKWEEFCEEVKGNPDLDPIFHEALEEDVWREAVTIVAGTILYRARLGWSETLDDGTKQPYREGEIGAPPSEKATAGRANKNGQSVLYVSEQEKTAVAEVRPARGFLVSVCELRPKQDLCILDLGRMIEAPNPFTSEPLQHWVEFVELLNSYGWELSRPLERGDDLSEYVPSQKLSGFIERLGFDGIRYPSAMETGGTNVVLFGPGVAEISAPKLVRIAEVVVDYEIYEND